VCREYLRGCCTRPECRYAHPPDSVSPDLDGTVRLCMDHVRGRCSRAPCRYYHTPHRDNQDNQTSVASETSVALPNGNVLPYKRAAAADKSGLPVYQPAPVQPAAPPPAYQHSLLQIQQQSFVPVTYHSGQPIAIPRYQWLHSKLVILAVKTDFVQDECCSVASTSGLMMAVVQPCIVIHTGDLNKLYSSRSPKHLKTSGTHSSLDTFCRKERIHIRFGKSYPTYS